MPETVNNPQRLFLTTRWTEVLQAAQTNPDQIQSAAGLRHLLTVIASWTRSQRAANSIGLLQTFDKSFTNVSQSLR